MQARTEINIGQLLRVNEREAEAVVHRIFHGQTGKSVLSALEKDPTKGRRLLRIVNKITKG